ncbi:hypothetical protein [Kribbella lupini]|uniref:hypothetical protein n=1 Tax=Kribbella lupini TaxID=291602 RepID=UPI0031DB6E5A
MDTYYDYEKRRWMHRRLGGGPVRPEPSNPPEAEEGIDSPEAGYRLDQTVVPPEERNGRQSGKTESSAQGGVATQRR